VAVSRSPLPAAGRAPEDEVERLPGELERPPLAAARTARAAEIVAAGRHLLEGDGPDGLTMRRVAEVLGIRAPSLYKHFPDKAALESAIVEDGLVDIGEASHAALHASGPGSGLQRLLRLYRTYSLSHPHLYRLATEGRLARDTLTPGLEEWAGNPWYVVTGDPFLAQAAWSFAHGMVVLELDGRYPPGSDLDRTWEAGAAAFEGPAVAGRAGLSAQLRPLGRGQHDLIEPAHGHGQGEQQGSEGRGAESAHGHPDATGHGGPPDS
jgi:AcrR family transcriptional regulator